MSAAPGAAELSTGEPSRVARLMERVGRHPAGAIVLFMLAVLEACAFPAPTEAAFVALTVANPVRAWRLAATATVGSLVGAVIGYRIGAQYFPSVGRPLLQWAGLYPTFSTVGDLYRDNVLLALVTSGYAPIPYVIYTYTAGAASVPLGLFGLGSLVGRGLKYAVLGALVVFGWQTISARINWRVVSVAVIALAAIWWLIRRA